MSNSQGRRREIIPLDKYPHSSTSEPSPKQQRTSRSTTKDIVTRSKGTVETAEPPRVIDSAERSSDPLRYWSEGGVEPAGPTRVMGSSERSSDQLEDWSATPEVDPEEAAIEVSPTRVNDSSERSGQPEDSTLMATSWILPEVPTSTGVDTGAMPMTHLVQAAWDASVMHVSMGADFRTW
jgi:hypothetical protein